MFQTNHPTFHWKPINILFSNWGLIFTNFIYFTSINLLLLHEGRWITSTRLVFHREKILDIKIFILSCLFFTHNFLLLLSENRQFLFKLFRINDWKLFFPNLNFSINNSIRTDLSLLIKHNSLGVIFKILQVLLWL